MNAAQQNLFNIQLWPAACRAQGWKPSDRALKLRVVGEILGRQITTTKEIGGMSQFTHVRQKLEDLARPTQPPAPAPLALISAATMKMLEDYFRKAVCEHCRRNQIDGLSDADVEALRAAWTTEALGRNIDWDILRPRQVDRLKPFLIAQADPDNEQKAAAVATAAVDGETRRVIATIENRALMLRQIEALITPERIEDFLGEGAVEQYIASVAEGKHLHRNWRGLLLPLLREQLMVTIEERAREYERLFKLIFCGGDRVLVLLEKNPGRFEEIAAQVATLRRFRTLEQARAKRDQERADKRRRRRTVEGEAPAEPRPETTSFIPFENQF